MVRGKTHQEYATYFICSYPTFKHNSCSDEQIAKNVEVELYRHLNPFSNRDFNIRITVKQGVVTLTGSVARELDKDSAELMAKGVRCVNSVVNKLTFSTSREAENDDMLRTLILQKLTRAGVQVRLPSAKVSGVEVSVSQGVVTLNGDVSQEDFQKVLKITEDEKPKNITNHMHIKTSK